MKKIGDTHSARCTMLKGGGKPFKTITKLRDGKVDAMLASPEAA